MSLPSKEAIATAVEAVYTLANDPAEADQLAQAAQVLGDLVDRVPGPEQPDYCPEALGALELADRLLAIP